MRPESSQARATLPKAVRGEGTGTISPLKSRKTLQEAFDLTFRLEWRGGKSEKTMTLNRRQRAESTRGRYAAERHHDRDHH